MQSLDNPLFIAADTCISLSESRDFLEAFNSGVGNLRPVGQNHPNVMCGKKFLCRLSLKQPGYLYRSISLQHMYDFSLYRLEGEETEDLATEAPISFPLSLQQKQLPKHKIIILHVTK